MGNTQTNMWDGRFAGGMAPSMVDLSFSLHVDREMLEEDIQGSLGHGRGLVQSGVLSESDYAKIREGLESIRADVQAGKTIFNATDEDVHMAVERVLTERIGDLGKKIHTGRSRNDQVATDYKLYMRHRAEEIRESIKSLQRSILALAREHLGKVMPGYTHVQQAQPILFSHYLMAFFFVLQRDRERLGNFLRLHSQLPLGSGAMAGSAFPYQRKLVAAELGFADVSPNSIDAVSHRDMALEFVSDLAITASTLSRYAEDFVNWSSAEFGFLTLHDAFSSGSSMMPQKKNPDSMELMRGKAGRMLGNYTTLFTVVKGAPLSYSRDLQEDKEPVFDSVHTIQVCLRVMREALETAQWNFATMERKMLGALLATDLADLLVECGVPFRDAHHIVGRMVGEASKRGIEFNVLPDEFWEALPGGVALRQQLTYEFSINRRSIEGGTGRSSVEEQFAKADRLLAE
ncbi:MAG TPA: argininosuccinate lyase [Fibrobacteraceae bacterium]|nr:argininosuccinate lyase [Fibrobacteraceae bacterium]